MTRTAGTIGNLPGCVRWVVLACVLAAPAGVQAQPTARWDASALGGWMAGHAQRGDTVGFSDTWFDTAIGGATVGRYVTPHLKLEIDGTWSGQGTQYVQLRNTLPDGAPYYPVGAHVSTSMHSAAASVSWQFLDNAWVHPFVLGGVSVDREQRSLRVFEQRVPGDPRVPTAPFTVIPERREGPETSVVARAHAGGGVKLYLAERAFIRADTRVAFAAAGPHVLFRVGAGFDF